MPSTFRRSMKNIQGIHPIFKVKFLKINCLRFLIFFWNINCSQRLVGAQFQSITPVCALPPLFMQIFLVWGHCYYHSKQCYVIFTNAYFCDVERLGQYYFKKTLRPPSKFLCCCLKNLDGIHVTHSHSSLKQNNKMLMLQRWCHKSFVYNCFVRGTWY